MDCPCLSRLGMACGIQGDQLNVDQAHTTPVPIIIIDIPKEVRVMKKF